jgi:hypothetical protein
MGLGSFCGLPRLLDGFGQRQQIFSVHELQNFGAEDPCQLCANFLDGGRFDTRSCCQRYRELEYAIREVQQRQFF